MIISDDTKHIVRHACSDIYVIFKNMYKRGHMNSYQYQQLILQISRIEGILAYTELDKDASQSANGGLVANNLRHYNIQRMDVLESISPSADFEEYTELRKLWSGIKQRCYNSKCTGYKHYGGRGITMYYRWKDNPSAFIAWILTYLGSKPSPNHSLDRIDPEGNYEPENIQWATSKEQNNNKRVKVFLSDVLNVCRKHMGTNKLRKIQKELESLE